MELLRREFRAHCVERHRLDPPDTERDVWFDLLAHTMTLLISLLSDLPVLTWASLLTIW
jgi:hypothetical protein